MEVGEIHLDMRENTLFETRPEELEILFESKNFAQISESFLRSLNTSLTYGISTDTVKQRAELYGRNALPEARAPGFWACVFHASNDKTLLLLIAAGLMSSLLALITGENWVESGAIFVAVAVVILVSSINDYQRAREFQVVANESENVTTVKVLAALLIV